MNTLKGVLFWIGMGLLLALCAFILHLIDAAWYGWLLYALAAVMLALRYAGSPSFLKRALCVLGCVAMLACGVIFGRPDMRVSVEGTIAREVIGFARGLDIFRGERYFDTINTLKSTFKAPDRVTHERGELGGVPAETLTKKAAGGDVTVLYLHGGGYRVPLQDIYRKYALKLLDKPFIDRVILLDYSVAPDAVYPRALNEALAAWRALAAEGATVYVMGDSAGANLALALTRALIDSGEQPPAKLVIMSPWADIGGTGELRSVHIVDDPMFTGRDAELTPGAYFEGADLKDPLVSPIYADYSGFPPMLIQVGEREIMWADAYTINARAIAAGVSCTLSEYRGMFHTFQLAGGWIPEAVSAQREIELFLDSIHNP